MSNTRRETGRHSVAATSIPWLACPRTAVTDRWRRPDAGRTWEGRKPADYARSAAFVGSRPAPALFEKGPAAML
jgi:hypothetical protein